MRGRRTWSESDLATLRELYADTPTVDLAKRFGRPLYQVYQAAARLGLRKSAAYLASPAACRLRRGDNVGAGTRFKPGHVPWTTGLKGYCPGGRAEETRFKPGHRGGRALEKYQPIGTDRLSKDGILQRKVHDGLPMQSRWEAVHVIEWEAVNGPVPPGHIVVFRDGDRANFAIDNLELISRAENLRRNSIHQLPPELVKTCQLKGVVTRLINKRAKS